MSLKRRLARAEQLAPQPEPRLSAPWELLSIDEVEALLDGAIEGTLSQAEFARMALTAHARQGAGWTRHDAARLGEVGTAKQARAIDLLVAVGMRHGRGLILDRFDAGEVSLPELTELVRLAQQATTEQELHASADAIGRLRIDGRPVSLSRFAALVLKGEF